MTAFAGFVRPRGAPPHAIARDVRSLARALARGAGVDVGCVTVDAPTPRVAVARVVTAATPPSLAGASARAQGEVILVADARLDDRAAAARRLDLDASRATDAEILLAAYRRWGDALPEHIDGDFALAVVDARRERVACIRDRYGVRPLWFHHAPEGIAFATRLDALLSLSWVPREVDDALVAAFLASVAPSETATGYAGIRRAPPCSAVSLSATDVRVRRADALPAVEELRSTSDDECAELFREAFESAVHARMTPGARVGSTVSGGLDSSSIACVAARRLAARGEGPLPTFSGVFPTLTSADESAYIDEVVRGEAFSPSRIDFESPSPLASLRGACAHGADLYLGPTLFLHHEVCRAASRRGVDVLLDGFDGDSVVSHGVAHLVTLWRRGRWIRLAREVDGLSKRFGRARAAILFRRVLLPWLAHGARRVPFAARLGRDGRARDVALVAPDLRTRAGLDATIAAERERERSLSDGSARGDHRVRLSSPWLSRGFEITDTFAGPLGVRPAYPFHDRRLVELCLSLPAEQKLRRGWTRWVLRTSMRDILPERVRWRGGKANLSPALRHALRVRDAEELRELVRSMPSELGAWVHPDVDIDRLLRAFTDDDSSERPLPPRGRADLVTLWKLVTLQVWSRSVRARGSPSEREPTNERDGSAPPALRVSPAGSALARALDSKGSDRT